jgi:tRNA threonylcarbamoyladenosine biosynthesis protein TsaB
MEGSILAIETSGEGGGAAVLREGRVVAEAEVSGPRRHGAELLVCVDRVVAEASLRREDLDMIAVNRGPGSYTGLRIGLSAAAALGFALERPVVGVSCFDAMALQYVMADDFEVSARRELWPVLDARRGEVMTARFLYDSGDLARATGDMLVAPEMLHEQARHQAIVFGEGVKPYQDRYLRDHLFVDRRDFALRPASVALQAYRQLAGIEDPEGIETVPVEPVYFRRVLAKTVEERADA